MELDRSFGHWTAIGGHRISAGWGARAILTGTEFQLLPDRQSWDGTNEDCIRALGYVLNNQIIRNLRDKVRELVCTGEINPSKSNDVFLPDLARGVEVCVNTNGSHGYLYIIAYVIDDPTAVTNAISCIPTTDDREVDLPEGVKYSGKLPIPELGAKIEANANGHKTSATVMGRIVFKDWVYCLSILDNPPDWWVQDRGKWSMYMLPGCDIIS